MSCKTGELRKQMIYEPETAKVSAPLKDLKVLQIVGKLFLKFEGIAIGLKAFV